MQVSSINNLTNFGATIKPSKNCEKFKEVLASRKLVPVSYDEFCEKINKLLPDETDTVTFKYVLPTKKDAFDIRLKIENKEKKFEIGIINNKDRVIEDILSMITLCQQRGGTQEHILKIGPKVAIIKYSHLLPVNT